MSETEYPVTVTTTEVALIEAALRTHQANTFPSLTERLTAKALRRKLTAAVAVAVFAMLAVAVPASAQTIDLPALVPSARHTHTAVTHVQRTVNRCETPDDAEVLALAEQSNLIAQQSAGVAPNVGGRQHVQALSIYDTATSDFYWLTSYQSPPICYQPPA